MEGWKAIVVATDFSPGAQHAVNSALSLAAPDTELHLVHVLPPPPAGYQMLVTAAGAPDLATLWREGAEAEMSRAVAGLDRRKVEGHVRSGRAWYEVLTAARELGADLVALGASGHSRVARLVLGSTAENVVRRSDVPVLVVRGRALRRLRRIVLPVELDAGSARAARFVRDRLAAGAKVEALHVVPAPLPFDLERVAYLSDTPEKVDAQVRALLDEAGLPQATVRTSFFADAAAEILSFARGADLVVIATHGRTGVARALLGSVAEKVVRHAPCPVLVLPAGAANRRPARGRRTGDSPRRTQRRGRPSSRKRS